MTNEKNTIISGFEFNTTYHDFYGFGINYNAHSTYDVLYGTTNGSRPMYLDFIDYILNNPTQMSFTKDELISHSKYKAACSELFASFNRNKILVYAHGYPYYGWIRGYKFNEWVTKFYPEAVTNSASQNSSNSNLVDLGECTRTENSSEFNSKQPNLRELVDKLISTLEEMKALL